MKKENTKKNEGLSLSNAEPMERPMEETSLEQRIAEKAYELFQQRGGDHGYHLEDWLEAERIISTEQKPEADAATGTQAPSSVNPSPAARPKSGRKRNNEQKAAS
ncbi:MAG: DUF2934 domain-containing protein [Nitrospirae bacterium]|nr:DUF2934 domain-containing protein [Candidatus Manganitrophaceae bacterium]